jgi:MFS family permease
MREPGFIQGLVLVSLAWVSPVAAVVIAPVLPAIAHAFQTVPGVDFKIPLVATGPSLLVALLATPYGVLADKIGRRTLLLATLFAYGAAGIAPLFLKSLDAIVWSRLAVGLAEAAIMTCATALIGDYFSGRRRERWLAAQAGVAPLAAVGLVILGGALGAGGWRYPFSIYAWGFVLVPLVMLFIWEPPARRLIEARAAAVDAAFSWAKPIGIAVVVVLSMIAFMVTVVQFSFLVTERGLTQAPMIGLWSAVVTMGNPIGALLFTFLKSRTSTKLVIAYGLFAIGFAVMSLVPTVPAAVAGGFIANLGAGFMFPTVITWLLSTMPGPLLGRGSGLWTSANFLGQFLGPLAILLLTKVTGSLSHAILGVGVCCALGALVTAPSMIRGWRA